MFQEFGIESADGKSSDRYQRKPTEVPENRAIQQSLVQPFGDIKDPRAERTKKHLLTDTFLYYTLIYCSQKSNNIR